MRETTKQNLSILAITVLIAASVFVFTRYIKPAIAQTKVLLAGINGTQEKIKMLQDYKSKFDILVQTYQNAGDDIEMIKQALPNEAQTAQVLSIFDSISKKLGISLTNLTFSNQEQDNYNTLTIKVDLTTTYTNFKIWLSEIEKELRLIDLNKISIKVIIPSGLTGKKATIKSSSLLRFTVDFTTYYQS